jgi:hypothetical protein
MTKTSTRLGFVADLLSKAIHRPSGDQFGCQSRPGDEVTLAGSASPRPWTQMSWLPSRSDANAIKRPSGESTGSMVSPASMVNCVRIGVRNRKWGVLDKIPFGAAMNKGLTIRMGQTHVNRWTDDLLRRIEEGQIDPSFVVTHRVDLAEGPGMYKTFRDKKDKCIKVVLKP